MISTEKLEDILIDQLQAFNEKELGVPRDIDFETQFNKLGLLKIAKIIPAWKWLLNYVI